MVVWLLMLLSLVLGHMTFIYCASKWGVIFVEGRAYAYVGILIWRE
jgi:hypothetical protein